MNLKGNTKLIAEVTNTQGNGRTLSPDECFNGLDSEVTSCYYGGKSTKNGWTFRLVAISRLCSDLLETVMLTTKTRADPEVGRC